MSQSNSPADPLAGMNLEPVEGKTWVPHTTPQGTVVPRLQDDPTYKAPPRMLPNADREQLLAEVSRRQAEVDPRTGERRYAADSMFRAETEAMRARAYTGTEAAATPGPSHEHKRLEARLNAFSQSVDPRTGQRFAPEIVAKIEGLRARLYAGETGNVSRELDAAEERLQQLTESTAEAQFTSKPIEIAGYTTITPPAGFELDKRVVENVAAEARLAGVSPEQFSRLVSRYLKTQ